MEKSTFTRDYGVFLRCLREARARAGLTQAGLAGRLDRTQSFVSKCERGERRLDIVEVRASCAAMGVPWSSFSSELDRAIGEPGPGGGGP